MSARKSSLTSIVLLVVTLSLFSDSFSFKGDKLETVLAQGKERTVLTGNVEIVSDENLISANRVELYGKDFTFVQCNGNVDVKNEKRGIHLVSDNLFYNRKEKVVRVQGKAVMEDKKNEIVAKGGFLEDWENDEITIIQIGVRILKKDLVCRSEFARYIRKENKLELSGMPVVFYKGDEYRASKIFIDLDSDKIKLVGEIKGKIVSENE